MLVWFYVDAVNVSFYKLSSIAKKKNFKCILSFRFLLRFLKWGFMRNSSIISVLPAVDGDATCTSLKKQQWFQWSNKLLWMRHILATWLSHQQDRKQKQKHISLSVTIIMFLQLYLVVRQLFLTGNWSPEIHLYSVLMLQDSIEKSIHFTSQKMAKLLYYGCLIRLISYLLCNFGVFRGWITFTEIPQWHRISLWGKSFTFVKGVWSRWESEQFLFSFFFFFVLFLMGIFLHG